MKLIFIKRRQHSVKAEYSYGKSLFVNENIRWSYGKSKFKCLYKISSSYRKNGPQYLISDLNNIHKIENCIQISLFLEDMNIIFDISIDEIPHCSKFIFF